MTIDRAADSAAAERMRRAAIDAFAESGYGGSSTRQIAKRLNMSATAMYPHYRSKEELLYAIALEGHSGLLAALREDRRPRPRASPSDCARSSRHLPPGMPRTTSWPASCNTNCTV